MVFHMINETDLKIEKMSMLKRIGEGLHIEFTCDYYNPEWDEEDGE